MADIQKIKAQHRAVARYLAFGYPLGTVCDSLGLNVKRWQVIVNTPLFQALLQEKEASLEEKLIEDECYDPVLIKAKMESKASLETMVYLRDGDPEEVPAATKLSSAKSILELAGYPKKESEQKATHVTISFSPDKAESLNGIAADLEPQPDSFKG
jgi:hypothetical protein